MQTLFSDLTVVELASVLAGPAVGNFFSELGAQVIKVENKKNIKLIEMDAEDMNFVDNTFDTVVTSCVFCSVPDPIKGLKEIRRVCKNNGKIIMLEHMRSNNEFVGKFMDIVNFIPLNIWGANINRQTMKNLNKAGFKENDIEYQDIWSDIVKLIEIRNNK